MTVTDDINAGFLEGRSTWLNRTINAFTSLASIMLQARQYGRRWRRYHDCYGILIW